MKEFLNIVATVLQQGKMTAYESPEWDKQQLCAEVELSLQIHEHYKS